MTYGDPLAQSVEHHTFNVGVLGSSPKRITFCKIEKYKKVLKTAENQQIKKLTYFFEFLNFALFFQKSTQKHTQKYTQFFV